MILAQSDGMFASVNMLATPFAQGALRALPVVVPRFSLTAVTAHVWRKLSGMIVYNLLALIAGFAVTRRHIAGAWQGFMVYFSRIIHGKFDGSNEKPSFAAGISPAISGNMARALELAMKRCGR